MKADKSSIRDRRNEKRGVYKSYKDIVDEEHKDVPTCEEKKPIKEIVEEYKVEEPKVEEPKVEESKGK